MTRSFVILDTSDDKNIYFSSTKLTNDRFSINYSLNIKHNISCQTEVYIIPSKIGQLFIDFQKEQKEKDKKKYQQNTKDFVSRLNNIPSYKNNNIIL